MKLLIVEDSERLGRSLREGLTKSGYSVDLAVDGEEAIAFLSSYEYEVVVLDLLLPKIPGLDVLRWVRSQALDVHVLILSAKDQVEDRVEGLSVGADDYLVKPFQLTELLARLRAVTRRRFRVKNAVLVRGSLEIDLNRREVRRRAEVIDLTRSEFSLLEILALRPGQVYSKAQLLHSLYGSDEEVTENMIEVFVSSLRRKLHHDGQEEMIRTRRGFGYYFDSAPDA